jgi:hypothetical protein
MAQGKGMTSLVDERIQVYSVDQPWQMSLTDNFSKTLQVVGALSFPLK